ncbi:MAG: tetratricopeptide repeat protein [Burkholderiales bacterium]|nr:tetratricopeptide repeat protein [Burkholderiales bacterium]
MATPLDLQEQEQLDALKSFWKQYGNLITWVLTLALAGFAAWNGWQWYQRDQAMKAGAIYDELDRAAQAGELERAARAFADLRERHPGSTFASHAALLLARLQADQQQSEAARASLAWVVEKSGDDALRAVARLRLAGLLIDAGEPDAALQQLGAIAEPGFEALAADRRGDALAAQGKTAEARAAWEAAWKGMDERLDYRQLVEAKLAAIGAAPAATAAEAAR